MLTVNYVLRTDLGEKRVSDGDLLGFVANIHKLFVGRLVPPLSVVNDVLLRRGDEICAHMTWDPFSISEVEYDELLEGLQAVHNFKSCGDKCNVEVNNYIDWYLWAMESAYGVPADQHRELELKVRDAEYRLDKAIKAKEDSKKINAIHAERFSESMKLKKFLDKYI